MKKKIILTLSAFISLCGISFSQCMLEISISGMRNNNGHIMLQVFDEKENVIRREISSVKDKTCTIIIKDLKPGRYAVRYYHDENLNGKMDTNILGKPIEGYGFSNNAAGKFGPPPIDKCLFELVDQKKIILDITY